MLNGYCFGVSTKNDFMGFQMIGRHLFPEFSTCMCAWISGHDFAQKAKQTAPKHAIIILASAATTKREWERLSNDYIWVYWWYVSGLTFFDVMVIKYFFSFSVSLSLKIRTCTMVHWMLQTYRALNSLFFLSVYLWLWKAHITCKQGSNLIYSIRNSN